jgi:hypothetical protein
MVMATSPRQTYVPDTAGVINQVLQFIDHWAALKAESDTWTANGIALSQPDIDAYFGAGAVTLAQFNTAMTTIGAVADFCHSAQNGPKLYIVKK